MTRRHDPLMKFAVSAFLCVAAMRPLVASEMVTATYSFSQLSPTTWNYDFTVTDTGTTPIGTFWLSWLPGEGFMPTAPLSAAAPTHWSVMTTNGTTSGDGFSEQWVDDAGALMPGQSISGLSFVSATTPADIAGASPFHGGVPELTSDVYMGAPLVGPDAPLLVTLATPIATPEPSTVVMILATGALLLIGKRRRFPGRRFNW